MESNKMSLGKQISLILIIVSVILLTAATAVAVIQIKNSLMKASEDKVSEILELSYNVLDGFNKQVQNGELTKAEAQKEAIKELNKFRYQGYNYVWVNDYDTKFIVHPTNPVGSDGKKIADPDGKHFFKDLTDIARSGEKTYLPYKWTKPGMSSSKYFPKTSTAITYPAWGWVLATGVYVDEIDKIIAHTVIILVILDTVLLVLLLALTQLLFVRRLTKEMNNITEEMENGAGQVAQASHSLEKASEKLAEGSNEQAASIQEIAATIEESASMVTKNNENSNYAAILVKEVTEKANISHDKMNQMMKAMEKINNSSNEISKIIKLIDEIAFQTNILALNAAVEAARAGDAGKGFAVVAEEVRNLAQRSTVSAKDTTKLIDENITLSQEGSTLANAVYSSIEEIDTDINKINGLVQEVSVSSQEQLLGTQQIQTAINQMEQVLQMNAQTADTNSEASQELAAQTHELNGLIDRLATIIEGSKK